MTKKKSTAIKTKKRPERNWMTEFAGISKDDPYFDMYMEEIRKYRKLIDRLARRGAK